MQYKLPQPRQNPNIHGNLLIKACATDWDHPGEARLLSHGNRRLPGNGIGIRLRDPPGRLRGRLTYRNHRHRGE